MEFPQNFYHKFIIMKKILLPLAAIALTVTACNTTPMYKVAGTVEGEQTGTVYLLKRDAGVIDTLATAQIADGKFTMEGVAEGVSDAYFALEGKRGGVPVFLEKANYTVNLTPENISESVIEGGQAQALANQFRAISNEIYKAQSELSKTYREAAEVQDTAKMKEIEAQFEELRKASSEKEDALISANPDTYVAAYILTTKIFGLDADELKAKYDVLGENAKATVPGKKIADRIAILETVAIGQVAPDFTLNTPDGTPLSMHSIQGKVKLIDFWASWCGPCRGENPNVVKIYEEFHPKGLEILSVSLDRDKDAWVKAIADDNLTWNHVSDLKFWDSEAAKLYAVNSIPHIVILDENNTIVAKNLRGDELKAKIAEMLQ